MMDVGTQLFKEANEKLKAALKAKDLKQVAVAQAMLDSAQKTIDGANMKMNETRNEQHVVAKKRQSMMDNFVAKKLKS